MRPARSRIETGLAIVVVIAAGLFSRTPAGRLPWAAKEVGDVLYAVMFYGWMILLWPRISWKAASGLAIGITFVIEFLKLYHVPWFEAIRASRVGGLVLGHQFYWHDLLCYVIGATVAAALDQFVHRPQAMAKMTELN